MAAPSVHAGCPHGNRVNRRPNRRGIEIFVIGHILSDMDSAHICSSPSPHLSSERKETIKLRRIFPPVSRRNFLGLPQRHLFPLRASSRNPLNPLETTPPHACISPVVYRPDTPPSV